jgi:type II secretory pathway pseudopilin PulG
MHLLNTCPIPIRERGLVLLTVLVFVLVSTLAASSLVVVYTTQMAREREEQLLFAGGEFRRAIASYYNTLPPGGVRALPQSLEVLLDDERFVKPVHHLRRLYTDPFTGKADWQVIRNAQGIVGVSSKSSDPTIKKKGFGKGNEALEDQPLRSEWIFAIKLL